ncbi:MAG TPA: hypothetical protein VF855_14050, partial [Acidimicrobiales bacterium]
VTPVGVLCTHGPDAAPEGVDVTRQRSVAELATTVDAAATGTGIPCYGDGVSGTRVQAIYARASDVADRFGAVAPLIAGWAANTDKVFVDSALKTGGEIHIRYVTDPSCQLAIQPVVLSTNGDDSFSNTVTELKNLGFNRTDRKYLIWADANVYCGIGNIRGDDRPTGNSNDIGPSYARTDAGCWGSWAPVEAHELMHNIGGVQLSAPHTSGGWHCTDESDRMCYSDAAGVQMVQVCSGTEALFDCNNDDYFASVAPAGGYLASKWNAANSAYLSRLAPDGWSSTGGVTTTTTVAPTTTTMAPTTTTQPTTVTTTFSGSLNRRNPSRQYTVSSGSGTLDLALAFSKSPSMTLTVKDSSSATLLTKSGPSVVRATANIVAGTYVVVVSGGSGSFTLTVTAPR